MKCRKVGRRAYSAGTPPELHSSVLWLYFQRKRRSSLRCLAGTPGEEAVTGPIRSAGELRTMFATKLQQYGERLKEEARQKGREQEKRETARAMKERSIDVAIISDVTGLSEQEIKAL